MTATPINPNSTLPGVKIMLLGATGVGKTHCLRTLVEAGTEVFVIFSEPGMEVLADVPSDKLHWHYIAPSSPGFAQMISSAQKINSMNIKMLSDLSDINKKEYTEFIDVLVSLADFPDDRTGQHFGPVDLWGVVEEDYPDVPPSEGNPQGISREKERAELRVQQAKYGLTKENAFGKNRAIVIDSMSGLAIMAMNLVAGSKPVKCVADWGIAIDNLERLITKLCVDVKCHFVLTAHLERETDEVTGGTTLMASTLGKKLAPKLPRFFSDVIHVKRTGTDFEWSTATSNVDLKARNLPLKDKIPPTFVPIIEAWAKKLQKQEVQPPGK